MKYLIMLVMVLALSGCTESNLEPIDTSTYVSIRDITIVEYCYDGVIYLTYYRGISVKFDSSGNVALCEE